MCQVEVTEVIHEAIIVMRDLTFLVGIEQTRRKKGRVLFFQQQISESATLSPEAKLVSQV